MKILDRIFKKKQTGPKVTQTAFNAVNYESMRLKAGQDVDRIYVTANGIMIKLYGPTIKVNLSDDDHSPLNNPDILGFAANVIADIFNRANELRIVEYIDAMEIGDHTSFQTITLFLPDAPKPPKYMVAEVNGDGQSYIPDVDFPVITVKTLDSDDSEPDREKWNIQLPVDRKLDNETAIEARARSLADDYQADREADGSMLAVLQTDLNISTWIKNSEVDSKASVDFDVTIYAGDE